MDGPTKSSELYIYHQNGPSPKSLKFMNSGSEVGNEGMECTWTLKLPIKIGYHPIILGVKPIFKGVLRVQVYHPNWWFSFRRLKQLGSFHFSFPLENRMEDMVTTFYQFAPTPRTQKQKHVFGNLLADPPFWGLVNLQFQETEAERAHAGPDLRHTRCAKGLQPKNCVNDRLGLLLAPWYHLAPIVAV